MLSFLFFDHSHFSCSFLSRFLLWFETGHRGNFPPAKSTGALWTESPKGEGARDLAGALFPLDLHPCSFSYCQLWSLPQLILTSAALLTFHSYLSAFFSFSQAIGFL